MFILAKLGFLPSIFLDLKYDLPFCASCMFGTANSSKWITKGKKSGSVKKETENNPGNGVSVDELQSAQPELVIQLSVKLTGARIWAAQVMVGLFSD